MLNDVSRDRRKGRRLLLPFFSEPSLTWMIELDVDKNPYHPPSQDSESRSPPTKAPLPRGLLYSQIVLCIWSVFVGISETNPVIVPPRWLMHVGMFAAWVGLGFPYAIVIVCRERGVSLFRILLAFLASVALSVVGFWAMLPLVQ